MSVCNPWFRSFVVRLLLPPGGSRSKGRTGSTPKAQTPASQTGRTIRMKNSSTFLGSSHSLKLGKKEETLWGGALIGHLALFRNNVSVEPQESMFHLGFHHSPHLPSLSVGIFCRIGSPRFSHFSNYLGMVSGENSTSSCFGSPMADALPSGHELKNHARWQRDEQHPSVDGVIFF